MNGLFTTALVTTMALVSVSAFAQCPGGSGQAQLGSEEVAGKIQSALVRSGSDIFTLYYTATPNGQAVMEGDIGIGSTAEIEAAAMLGPIPIDNEISDTDSAGNRSIRALVFKGALSGPAKWPNATIPYTITGDAPNQNEIMSAIKTWNEKTGIKFVERTNQNDYVVFKKGTDNNACWSETLGRKGGRQYVELVSGCRYGQILHEIGHVIGLHHEQSRSDRKEYIDIIFKNIIVGRENQFQQSPLMVDVGPYDYDTIMHYEPKAFSCNGQPTLVAKKPGMVIGQRDHLSAGDIAATKKIFGLP